LVATVTASVRDRQYGFRNVVRAGWDEHIGRDGPAVVGQERLMADLMLRRPPTAVVGAAPQQTAHALTVIRQHAAVVRLRVGCRRRGNGGEVRTSCTRPRQRRRAGAARAAAASPT